MDVGLADEALAEAKTGDEVLPLEGLGSLRATLDECGLQVGPAPAGCVADPTPLVGFVAYRTSACAPSD